jgi:hypothetical protein
VKSLTEDLDIEIDYIPAGAIAVLQQLYGPVFAVLKG